MDDKVENIREIRAEVLREAAKFFQDVGSHLVARILLEFADRAERGLDLFED